MKGGTKPKQLNAGAYICSTRKYASSPPETTPPSSSAAGATRLATTRIHLPVHCRQTPSGVTSAEDPTVEKIIVSTVKDPTGQPDAAIAAPNACSARALTTHALEYAQ